MQTRVTLSIMLRSIFIFIPFFFKVSKFFAIKPIEDKPSKGRFLMEKKKVNEQQRKQNQTYKNGTEKLSPFRFVLSFKIIFNGEHRVLYAIFNA